MKGYEVYSTIQQMKELGFKKATVANQLGINRRTVDRYWSMNLEEYDANLGGICKRKLLDDYSDTVVGWIVEYPTLSAARFVIG